MDMRTYRLSVDAVVDGLTKVIEALVRSSMHASDTADASKRLKEPLLQLVRNAREDIYRMAVAFLQEEARRQGAGSAIYIPSMSGYSDQTMDTVLRKYLKGDVDSSAMQLSSRLAQHAESAGRQAIVRSVEDGRKFSKEGLEHADVTRIPPNVFEKLKEEDTGDPHDPMSTDGSNPNGKRPRAWARVLSGDENCAFCVMLASRGPVYSSAADAGQISAAEKFGETGLKGYVNSYHTFCDCLVVPVYDYRKWSGRESYKELEKFYNETVRDAKWTDHEGNERTGISVGSGPSPRAYNQALAAMDRRLTSMSEAGETLPIQRLR